MSREIGYIGRGNTIRRKLQQDGVDLTEDQQAAVTRVQVLFGDYCIDTDVVADPISYADGVVEFQPGLVTDVAVGDYEARILAFDAVTPQGYAWGQFALEMRAWDACP